MKKNTVTLPQLEAGKETFLWADLIRLAATSKGLELEQVDSQYACSKLIKVYPLDEKRLQFLESCGIKREPRSDCRDVFTLVDENPQKPSPGYDASNYWNFHDTEDGRKVSMYVGFNIDQKERGVLCFPGTIGTIVGPADSLPNYRMFRALVESDPECDSAIAKEIAASKRYSVITWTELGLAEIREISELFEETFEKKETIEEVARKLCVFDPRPYPEYNHSAEKKPYIIEAAQPRLIKSWRNQLEKFRQSLVV